MIFYMGIGVSSDLCAVFMPGLKFRYPKHGYLTNLNTLQQKLRGIRLMRMKA